MYIIYLQPLFTDVVYQLNYLLYHAPSVIIQVALQNLNSFLPRTHSTYKK